jgi:D-alanine-D-alanine ligase-like ATP-grasp enzyme
MPENGKVRFNVLHGPSPLAPFAAVIAEFDNTFASLLPAARVGSQLAKSLSSRFRSQVELSPDGVAFEVLAASLANALQDLRGPCGLPVETLRTRSGRCRIALGFVDPQATLSALRAGIHVSAFMFGHSGADGERAGAVAAMLRRAEAELHSLLPDYVTRSLMRVARARGIPVYAVSSGSRVWMYGQGSAGHHFWEAANDHDSLTGHLLTRDKVLSNQLIWQLGLPGVAHGVARDVGDATQIAAKLGFPVVVKPIDSGKGNGVTANVEGLGELESAFAKASPFSARGVIVERHVAGEDHRLAVFGGRLAWVVRRSPPRILGDGQSTVAQLVEQAIESRSAADIEAGFINPLAVDDDMLAVLAKQGLELNDRPPAGRSVQLRSIANMATGGTLVDCTAQTHPDNREMAEMIARSFRMDAVGIDFITTDISRSWREGGSAVIEVNATPGISADSHAETILRHKFPRGIDGRVPSIVILAAESTLADPVQASVQAAGLRVGKVDSSGTTLSGQAIGPGNASVAASVMALLLSPSCDGLVIRLAPQEVERLGFPMDRCDLVLIGDEVALSERMRELIGVFAQKIIDGVNSGNLESLVLPAIASMLKKRGHAKACLGPSDEVSGPSFDRRLHVTPRPH